MNKIDIKLWQKRAGIISEASKPYTGDDPDLNKPEMELEEVVDLTESPDQLRKRIKEAFTSLLQEKKKTKSKKSKSEVEPTDDAAMPEEGEELDITAPEGGEGEMVDMGMEAEPMGAQGGENELMQKTLQFQSEIESATDDDKYKQIVQNLVSYLARKMNVEK